jgi:hypothetical protein
MSINEAIARINKNTEENNANLNKLIDKEKAAYKIADTDGNTFVFAGLESGFPIYRGNGGSKHIFDLLGYEIIEKYVS